MANLMDLFKVPIYDTIQKKKKCSAVPLIIFNNTENFHKIKIKN